MQLTCTSCILHNCIYVAALYMQLRAYDCPCRTCMHMHAPQRTVSASPVTFGLFPLPLFHIYIYIYLLLLLLLLLYSSFFLKVTCLVAGCLPPIFQLGSIPLLIFQRFSLTSTSFLFFRWSASRL